MSFLIYKSNHLGSSQLILAPARQYYSSEKGLTASKHVYREVLYLGHLQ